MGLSSIEYCGERNKCLSDRKSQSAALPEGRNFNGAPNRCVIVPLITLINLLSTKSLRYSLYKHKSIYEHNNKIECRYGKKLRIGLTHPIIKSTDTIISRCHS